MVDKFFLSSLTLKVPVVLRHTAALIELAQASPNGMLNRSPISIVSSVLLMSIFLIIFAILLIFS